MSDAEFRVNQAALNDQIRAIGRARMASLQRRIANQARQDVPVKTGNLGRSVGEGRIGFTGPRTITGSVHAAAPYAAAVHEGRRARVIVPRRASALRFQIGGRTVFAKMVRQGPVRGRPFLLNAARRIASRER